MIICNLQNGIYEGAILVQNREIEGKEIDEMVQMGLTLMKIDILSSEIKTVRTEVKDFAQMYKLLEKHENGNIMKNGTIWRSRAITTIKEVLLNVLQASKLTDAFDNHRLVLENFILMNAKNEAMEHVGVGWVESFERHIKLRAKLTRRDCNHIQQRIEIFSTKTQILREHKNGTNLGKISLFYKNNIFL